MAMEERTRERGTSLENEAAKLGIWKRRGGEEKWTATDTRRDSGPIQSGKGHAEWPPCQFGAGRASGCDKMLGSQPWVPREAILGFYA